MLTLLDNAHEQFHKAVDHAIKMDLLPQFIRQLAWINEYGRGGDQENTIVELGKDFAPYSFTLLYKMADTGTPFMNGGLIYQGPDSPADGSFPSLTVSLASGNGWFAHH